MARTACLVCSASTICGRCKNALRRGSIRSRHITELQQAMFFSIYMIYDSSKGKMNKIEKSATKFLHTTNELHIFYCRQKLIKRFV
jgi:hypothetical protein